MFSTAPSLKRNKRGALILAASFFCASPLVQAAEFSGPQTTEIQTIIKDYLLQNPEVLRDAIAELELKEKTAEADARTKIISDPASPLYSSAHQTVIGNPSGKISLVEFFDYNCGYCKKAMGDLAKLMKDNPDLKVILKDLPILSPGSVEAAVIANAAYAQFKGDKFWEYHQKLLGQHGSVGKAQALSVAKDMGADMDRLAKDAASADVKQALEDSDQIAKSLALNGTPSYVIGSEVVIGAVGNSDLQNKVNNIRKCGQTACT
jgi:protein-disulfide isomerase